MWKSIRPNLISRHLQYLGWIIWSYGYVIFASTVNQMKKTWGASSSLPWLLMTMVIIRDMYARGDQKEKYRAGTPFIFPLPGWLVRILKTPLRLIIHKEKPERRREVAWVVLVYIVIFMGLSLFWVDFGVSRSRQEQHAINNPQKVIDSLLVEISQTDSRRKVSGLARGME